MEYVPIKINESYSNGDVDIKQDKLDLTCFNIAQL